MLRGIINSTFMWIVYLVLATSGIIVFIILFRILIWDNIKGFFKSKSPYNEREIMERDSFGEKSKVE